MVLRNIWENESKFCVFSVFTTSLQELIIESVEKLTWKVSFIFNPQYSEKQNRKRMCCTPDYFSIPEAENEKKVEILVFLPKT